MRLDSAKLREARQRRLLTQAELGKRAGTTEATVNRLENGLQTARISTIRKLAEALEVPAEELITWETETKGKAAA
ncbi:MAG: helix-turn-helix domain-containing protein [Chloroflexota bacterium]|nr:helix-turn-helix domain-containing protein [Chloroflexota bacterium]MDP9470484.1 helix-turn-helix domain-containing protein [Chloroflexota bacterium]